MIAIGKYIHDRLAASATITAKCGQRIYADWTDEPGVPCVAFSVETEGADYTKDGIGTDHHTVTVRCVGRNYATICELAEAARKALELDERDCVGYRVSEVLFNGASTDYLDEAQLHCYTLEFAVTTEDRKLVL